MMVDSRGAWGLPMSTTTTATLGDDSSHAPRGSVGVLALGALGVVYGDIGTSPLYTLKTALEWGGGATLEVCDRHAVADRMDAADHLNPERCDVTPQHQTRKKI
jgi:potassium transporter